MIHLGDITKISGYDAPVVDVIIGGSPCQDLSVAGKRAGLAGERSGLYMEQIRIVKEMREADVLRGRTAEFIRPRYMVWENVPGAFSSNGGKDFAAVIEEIIKVCEPDADVQVCVQGGWTKSGCYYSADGRWSIAWRLHDAQFWGVPQRRKRIALVADLGGLSAPEILFERKGVSGHSEPGKTKGQETARTTAKGTDSTVFCLQGNGIDRSDTAGCNGKGVKENVGYTLNTIDRHADCYGIGSYHSNSWKSNNPHSGVYEADTAKTLDALNCGYPGCNQGGIAVLQPLCYDMDNERRRGPDEFVNISPALTARAGTGGGNVPAVIPQTYQRVTGPLIANSHPGSYTGQDAYNDMLIAHTLRAKSGCDFREDSETYPITNHVVRRLTPLECERLQGFPDGWTNIGDWIDSKGKKHKEAYSPRYKALGNSIAIPPWKWVLKRLCACYERDATMASLFDGIGGFPLIWEQINGKGSCLWASEIEEFPMAVTKVRFGE